MESRFASSETGGGHEAAGHFRCFFGVLVVPIIPVDFYCLDTPENYLPDLLSKEYISIISHLEQPVRVQAISVYFFRVQTISIYFFRVQAISIYFFLYQFIFLVFKLFQLHVQYILFSRPKLFQFTFFRVQAV